MSRIITFYSYKGGVGRTFALANIAVLLARRGKRVLLMDWDLEAPGLHRYFKPHLPGELLALTGWEDRHAVEAAATARAHPPSARRLRPPARDGRAGAPAGPGALRRAGRSPPV